MKIEVISQRRETLLNVNYKPAISWFLQWRPTVSVSNTDFFLNKYDYKELPYCMYTSDIAIPGKRFFPLYWNIIVE